MKEMTEKDWFEHKMYKLRQKRNISFRAFAINIVLILIVWLCSMMPWYNAMVAHFMSISPANAQMFVLDIIGLWKVLNAVFFLVPGLALWWEMHACEKEYAK